MTHWFSDAFPEPVSRGDIKAIRAQATIDLAGEDWQPVTRLDYVPLAQRQTHRHAGCGHVCGDSHCVLSNVAMDELCTPCVRKWVMGRL